MLRAAGLAPLRRWGLHSVTNVIPSTILHRDRLGRRLGQLYRRLTLLDAALARWRPLLWMSNSVVILAQKEGGGGPGCDRNRQRDAALAPADRDASGPA